MTSFVSLNFKYSLVTVFVIVIVFVFLFLLLCFNIRLSHLILLFSPSKELMNQPVSISCGHSACKACLQASIAKNKKTCPICRVDIDNLNTNIAVRALISKIKCSLYKFWLLVGRETPRERKSQGQLPVFGNAVPQWLHREPTCALH